MLSYSERISSHPWIIVLLLSIIPYLGLTENIWLDVYWILKLLTWRLSNGRDDVHACAVMMWQCLCVRCHGVMVSVRVPWRFLYYIHYINSDLHCYFTVDGYCIYPSLRITISYTWTMSAYDFFLSVSSPSLSTLDSIPYFFIWS